MTHKRKTSVNLSAFRHHAIKMYMGVETKLRTFVTSEVAANIPNLQTPLGDYTRHEVTRSNQNVSNITKMFPTNKELKTPATLGRVNETTS
jgi:hypothetical protein